MIEASSESPCSFNDVLLVEALMISQLMTTAYHLCCFLPLCRMLTMTLLILVLCPTISLPQAHEVNDIFAGYKYNATRFFKARIVFYGEKSFFSKETAASKRSWLVDYWTDGLSLLVRGGDLSANHVNETFLLSHPPADFSRIELEEHYRDTAIMTFFSEDAMFRFWLWPSDSRYPSLRVSKQALLFEDTAFLFPPFMPFYAENEESLFPSDYFFNLPVEMITCLGVQHIDKKKYYVLEYREEIEGLAEAYKNVLRGTKYEGRDISVMKLITAWIDPAKGYLPIRIEESSWFSEGKKLLHKDEKLRLPLGNVADSCFEIKAIKESDTGAYFPMKSQKIFYRDDESANITWSIFDGIEGNVLSAPREAYREYVWDIVRVDTDVEILPETLVLPAIKGTESYDEQTQKANIVGMTDTEYEQMLRDVEEKWRMLGVVPDSGMVLPDPNSKRVPEDYIPRAPRGWRSAFFIIGVNLIIIGFIIRSILMSRKRGK